MDERTTFETALSDNKSVTKPFLRWAGGKTWLLKHLAKILTCEFNNYHEPFLGSGAVFLFIKPQNRSFLSDLNVELMLGIV